jgi:hypothetical protein
MMRGNIEKNMPCKYPSTKTDELLIHNVPLSLTFFCSSLELKLCSYLAYLCCYCTTVQTTRI